MPLCGIAFLMKFKYTKFGPHWRPIIPVVISYQGHELEYNALLDSGSDICIVHAEVGKALGINVTSGSKHPIGGITGSGVGYVHCVDITIGGRSIKDLPMSFSHDIPPDYGFGVLGHEGFFNQCKVIFDTTAREVELKFKEHKR